jgi:hypothetical protein
LLFFFKKSILNSFCRSFLGFAPAEEPVVVPAVQSFEAVADLFFNALVENKDV